MQAVLGLIVLAAFWTAAPARAEEPPPPGTTAAQACDVPAYLLTTESKLPKVADAIKEGHSLDILVVGSRSSTIPSSELGAYPARLQAILKEKLPSIPVNVTLDLHSKNTAAEVAAGFAKLVEDKKPTLVIWQTGTVDAMRSIDPDDFRAAVADGVAALQKAGTDVILMNLQYSPRTESMISGPPYLDNMRVVAQQYEVPLFDRFAIMRQWNDAGDFDFFSASHGPELAKRVHDCLGRALSTFVIDASRVNAAQEN